MMGGSKGHADDGISALQRGFDAHIGMEVVKIISGEWYVTASRREVVATILGSCISACIRDPEAGVGGMNHFLLPGEAHDVREGQAARYGVFAMESLINGVLSRGGQRQRLEIKLFGGGNVTSNSSRIGSKNAEFARRYIESEGLRVFAEDMGGTQARRLHYYPASGKVMVRRLAPSADGWVMEQEKRYRQTISARPVEGDIDLFQVTP